LAAFELLWRQQVDVNLVIVGKKGWMVDELAERISSHVELGQRLFWLDGISDEYLESRPRESQIGAWASPQSSIIHNRPVLESRIEFYTTKFKNKSIPRPTYWGGYLIRPNLIEFWQGQPSRLHDRIQYELIDGVWQTDRLAP
jgi:pyridoxamine-phosphate oxidase